MDRDSHTHCSDLWAGDHRLADCRFAAVRSKFPDALSGAVVKSFVTSVAYGICSNVQFCL